MRTLGVGNEQAPAQRNLTVREARGLNAILYRLSRPAGQLECAAGRVRSGASSESAVDSATLEDPGKRRRGKRVRELERHAASVDHQIPDRIAERILVGEVD